MFTLRVTIDFIDEIGFVGTTEHRAILGPPGQDKRISQRAARSFRRLALPREARELSRLNSLHEGLGLEPVIGFQGVSAAAPKPIGPLL